jgi:hypothetical protein
VSNLDNNVERKEVNNSQADVKSNEYVGTKKRKKNNNFRTLVVTIVAIVCFVCAYVAYRGNILQVQEIGEMFVNAFKSDVKYKIITIVASFTWMYLLVYITNKRIRKGLKVFFQDEKKEMPKFPNKSISFIAATITSIVSSRIFLQKVILFFNNTAFGKTDQIYGHDIGYYLFIQPFLQSLIIFMLVTFIIVTVYAAAYYIILINTQFSAGVSSETLKKSIIKHQILNNAKIIVILIATLTFINAENLSSQTFLTVGEGSSSYALVGAGTTDISIKVWGYRGLSILMVIAVFIAAPAYYNKEDYFCV